MTAFLTFLLGIANFAFHRAALESGHPMLRSLSPGWQKRGALVSLGLEYAVLVAALGAAIRGAGWGVALYAFYTASNALGCWLIATRRI